MLPSTLVEGLPSDIDYVLSRALAKPPGDRHPDCSALAEDIEDVLSGREPRHRAGWTPTRAPTGTLASTDPDASMAGTPSTAVAGPAREPRSRQYRALALKGGLAVLGLALGSLGVALLLPRLQPGRADPDQATAAPTPAAPPVRRPTATPTPVPTTTLAAETAVETTIPTTTTLAPARSQLVLDVEHPLRAGKLRIWIDKKIVREQEFVGKVDKNLLFTKVHKGRFSLTLEVSPGWHDVEVEVRWDRSRRADRISATFRSGDPRHLKVRLGRVRKNLSLEWK